MAKALDYSRIKLLLDSSEQRITLENMARILERSYSGFLKALRAGTIYAHEVSIIAEQLNMSVSDVYGFLEQSENQASEAPPVYIKRKRLADTSDPLEWVRLAMSKSKQFDQLIDGLDD
jgi:hypothetical protein